MAEVFLVKFRQGCFPLECAHWGIFLPTVRYAQFPTYGVLYHASKEWSNCFRLQGDTRYERLENFDLSSSDSWFDIYRLTSVNLADETISAACDRVSQYRQFNFFSKNCQEWVKEVLSCLVQDGRVDGGVFQEISLQGWITVSEGCRTCFGSSFPCGRCRRRL